MDTYNDIYPRIYDFDEMCDSYRRALKNASKSPDVLNFSYRLEENLLQLHNELVWEMLEPRPVHEFWVYDPKERLIAAPDFRDRIVHWQIYKAIYPIFSKGYIKDTYGSIEGGGAQKAVLRLMYWMRLMRNKYGKFYILKMDISKFFFRIPHDVAMKELSRKITDKRALRLFDTYINSGNAYGIPVDADNGKTGTRRTDVGFAPGSLFTQTLANIVLNPVDQYIKRDLHQHCYERYMDDMIIISKSKSELHEIKGLIEAALRDRGLELNKKTAITPGNTPIEFLGYMVSPDCIRLRRKTVVRARRKLEENKRRLDAGEIPLEQANNVFSSYLGLTKLLTSDALKKEWIANYGVPEPDAWVPPTLEELI